MKRLLILFTISILSLPLKAQSDPNCSHLTVQSLSLSASSNSMLVTLKNNCSNCTSGLSGCVYWELKVIRTISPFDTIASSKCWCLQSPNNGTQKTYSISTSATSIPALSDIRVSFMCGGGCDTIPFAIASNVNSYESATEDIKIYPNPAKDHITFTPKVKDLTVKLMNLQGKVVLSQKIRSEKETLDISTLEKGFYVLEISDHKNKMIRSIKISKE